MAGSHNPQEQAYKDRSIKVKFLQQMYLGIGGATVFGLVGAVATSALKGLSMATLATNFMVAWPVMLGIAVLGVGALYLGSHYLAENIMLDQEHQAQKIGLATRAPGVETKIENTPAILPGMGIEAADKQEPGEDKKWADKFAKNSLSTDWQTRTAAQEPPKSAILH